MKRNIKGFRLNKNGKPILRETQDVKHNKYKGASYKENGVYYFYHGELGGEYIYRR